ncbi:MAG: molybdate ABC transporter substrate-binding protein [Alphaproteobacteria bacterium]|nr:molybdate ABC transporter substrate-binding protein [Alphaproteobacteria bacterium]
MSIRKNFTKARWPRGICAWLALAAVLAVSQASAKVTTPVTVYAPTSLTNVLQVLSDRFAAKGLGAVLVTFASASELERRIADGAPVDLLITDQRDWQAALAGRGIAATGEAVAIRGSGLVFIARSDSPLTLGIPLGLHITKNLDGRIIAIGKPDAVPAGGYAMEALGQLGLWDVLTPYFLFARDVRDVLTQVERGEADAGIVYATDAVISNRVKVIGVIPETTHAPVRYHVVPVGTRTEPAVSNFLRFLQEPEVREILERFGFRAG